MEFPDLGSQCSDKSCRRLDYLPMRCDACSNIFCKDHLMYSNHSCKCAYQKDVQVPVCPLCNQPIPSKRGEQPDIAVGEHIDRDCQSDPAVSKRRVYTNKCSVKGCKLREIVKLVCTDCQKTYCLKHRHPADHKCSEQQAVTAAQAAAAAAIARSQAQNAKKSKFNWFTSQSCSTSAGRTPVPTLPAVSVNSVHGGLSEDEALALALHKSLNETKSRSAQEEEDRRLAQAIANCDVNTTPPRRNQQNQRNRDNCSLS